MQVRFKLWLEEDGQVLYGEGRQELLQALLTTGSLAGAARELGMSYRAAWGRLKASEDRLGFKLVDSADGGRRNLELTPAARRFMDLYSKLDQVVGQCAQEHLDDISRALVEERERG